MSNPSYESLLVQAKVTFMPELDPGFYLQKLNDDICGFLAPWSQTTAAAESINPFASLLSQALIMGFINGRDYIQSLESLDVYQFWTQNGETKSAMQKGEYDYFDVHQAWHILTTVTEHQLFDADSPASTQAIPLGKVIAASNVEGLPGIGEMGIVPHKIGKVELGQIEYLSIESNN